MRKLTINDTKEIDCLSVDEAIARFLKNCVSRNLSKRTIAYYSEDCNYFKTHTDIHNVDEITLEMVS